MTAKEKNLISRVRVRVAEIDRQISQLATEKNRTEGLLKEVLDKSGSKIRIGKNLEIFRSKS